MTADTQDRSAPRLPTPVLPGAPTDDAQAPPPLAAHLATQPLVPPAPEPPATPPGAEPAPRIEPVADVPPTPLAAPAPQASTRLAAPASPAAICVDGAPLAAPHPAPPQADVAPPVISSAPLAAPHPAPPQADVAPPTISNVPLAAPHPAPSQADVAPPVIGTPPAAPHPDPPQADAPPVIGTPPAAPAPLTLPATATAPSVPPAPIAPAPAASNPGPTDAALPALPAVAEPNAESDARSEPSTPTPPDAPTATADQASIAVAAATPTLATLPTPTRPPIEPRTTGDPLLGSPASAPAVTGRKRSGRRRVVTIIAVLAVLAGLATAAWVGYQRFSAERSSDGATADVEPSARPTPEGEPQTIFDDTQQLVDDINDDPGVTDALDALGLDPTGAPVPATPATGDTPADGVATDGAAAPAPVASYGFRWSDPFGLDVTVQVDAATGDYIANTSDGTEIRRVGGRYFGLAANSGWVELSPDVVSGIPVVGLDGMLDDAGIVPSGLEQFVIASEVAPDGTVRLLVDDAALSRTNAVLREEWLGPWGLIDPEAPIEDPAPTDGVPTSATDGQVVVSILHGADGAIAEVVVSSPSIGGTATYSLSSTAIYPLVVDVPTELAGG